eukprot:CAMPEP_0114563196 /NCGR_PEP_ID=MMETSP0114-20121206/12968_1 /TAXON_ID=31324 /ORGANISM="Goniomonas sp, Strain m" /LENGTH=870 /DNA_ID=CAMNT_0001749001 /DNA_START=415 /DNA_END=3024 /DNA_ORIENTATION=+
MSYSKFKAMWFGSHALQVFPNPLLVKKQWVDPDLIIKNYIDQNRDGVISLPEFLVVFHFWSPLIWSQSGPSVTPDTAARVRGVAGGFYFDFAAWVVWVSQAKKTASAANLIPEASYNGSEWLIKFRAPQIQEAEESFTTLDLDLSRKYTLHEHYFQHWADTDRDSKLSRAEFDASLYVNPNIPNLWEKHDLDGDGFISFMERKFFAADTDNSTNGKGIPGGGADGLLSADEWIAADFPVSAFRDHNINMTDELADQALLVAIDSSEYNRFAAYSVCTRAVAEHHDYPWNTDLCNIHVIVQGEPPFVRRMPDGSLEGFNVMMWREIVGLLDWSSDRASELQVYNSADDILRQLRQSSEEAEKTKKHTNITMALLSTADADLVEDVDLVCSKTIYHDDGLSIVVNQNPSLQSLEALVPELLVSASFLQFLCVIFLSVLFVGHCFWLAEKRRNSGQFSEVYVAGVLDGLYFCMVTLTTVGYGDKSPITGLGKSFGVVWMFLGLICFSIFSGEISSNIAASREAGLITSTLDLSGQTAGILPPSVGGKSVASDFGFTAKTYASVEEAFEALDADKVACLVLPMPIITSFFQKYGHSTNPCGNPYATVGEVFTQTPMNRLCVASSLGYIGTYLMNGVNAAVERLKAEKIWDRVLEQQMEEPGVSSTQEWDCSVADGYPRVLLGVTGGVMAVIAVFTFLYHRRREINKRAAREAASLAKIKAIFDNYQDKPRRYALHWLRRTRENTVRRHAFTKIREMQHVLQVAGLPERRDVTPEELRRVAISLGYAEAEENIGQFLSKDLQGPDSLMPLMQDMQKSLKDVRMVVTSLGSDVGRLHSEAAAQREQLGKVTSFFALLNGFNFIAMSVIVVILVVVW